MKKILMVCLGNICRSPLAQGILQHKLHQLHMDVEVDSAGTSAYHLGEKPDRRSIEIAKVHGIDISQQRARRFIAADFDTFDKIYAMDASNYADLVAKARSHQEAAKVVLILNMSYPGSNRQVPDPYYGGKDGFQHVFDLLDSACDQIVESIRQSS